MIKVAINGFGRIGRCAFREMIVDTEFDIVAINSLGTPEEFAYLLKYDSIRGSFFPDDITYDNENIIIKGTKKIRVLSVLDPLELPWGNMGVDLVLECTGLFTSKDDLSKHISAGAKKVVLSAPAKEGVKTIVYGVNDNTITAHDNIISAASCTTNCLAPVLSCIEDVIGIKCGYMTTVHAYTSDQMVMDGAHKKGIYSRRGRSAAENIVPASTGAAKAIGLVVPSLNGKINGTSLRVPTACGSVVDLTLVVTRDTTVDEINKILNSKVSDTLKFTMDPIVSSDVLGMKCGSMVDGLSTEVCGSGDLQLVKILTWYDNEMGYTAQMIRTAKKLCYI